MTGHADTLVREHVKGDAASVAVYSRCERYRYALTRVWDPQGARATFLMLNPSTATEVQNDPTVERCERRARALGFGAFRVCNIFAWRDTDPRDLKRAEDPVGPLNDKAILEGAAWSGMVICAWGSHGAHLQRGRHVARLLSGSDAELTCLGETKHGHPKHPLYIGYQKQLESWSPARLIAGQSTRS